jgi:hypothetical protein
VCDAHVVDLYYVVGYVVKPCYLADDLATFRLRSVNARLPSWNAAGLVEKAWRRITPPTQEELRKRLGLSARTNLSKLNKGTMLMTLDYAERIVVAVRQDDPSFSVADLGAPQPVVAEADPTVLRRLEQVATKHDRLRKLVLAGFLLLDLEVDDASDQESPQVRRTPPPRSRRKQNGGSQ